MKVWLFITVVYFVCDTHFFKEFSKYGRQYKSRLKSMVINARSYPKPLNTALTAIIVFYTLIISIF